MKVLIAVAVTGLWASLSLGMDNDVKAFLENFEKSQKQFKDSFGKDNTEKGNRVSPDDRFLKSVVATFKDKKKFAELDLMPVLRDQLLTLANEAQDPEKNLPKITELTLEDLEKILEKNPDGINDEMKRQLAALVLLHTEKASGKSASNEDAMKTLIKDYLEVTKILSPEKEITLPKGWKEAFKLKPEDKNSATAEKILSLIEENKGVVPPTDFKEGLALVTDLMKDANANPEAQDIAFQPIARQLFNGQFAAASPEVRIKGPQSAGEARQLLNEIQQRIADGRANNSNLGNRRANSGGGGRGGNQKGAGSNSVPAGPSAGSAPARLDDEQLQACVDLARKTNANIPISIPGGECASTAVSATPEADMEQIRKTASDQLNKKRKVTLVTALHCVEGLSNLEGSTVGLRLNGQIVQAPVVADVNPDGTGNGRSVEGGNPDMTVIQVELTNEQAKALTLLRVPTPSEVRQLAAKSEDSLPVVLYQNTKLNVDRGGNNKGVIASRGKFDTSSNFVRFNADSALNQGGLTSEGFLDSNKIQSGDSGGTGATCSFRGKEPKELLYLGAVSHVDVFKRGTGSIGGVSSGKSLLNLSKRIYPDENSLALAGGPGTQPATHQPN